MAVREKANATRDGTNAPNRAPRMPRSRTMRNITCSATLPTSSDDLKAFVEDALKPAAIKSMNINEEEKTIRVFVEEEELSKAIGRRGQNVRLTTRLVGWDVQVQKDESAHEAFEAKIADAAKAIAAAGIDLEQATELVRGGVNSLSMLANDVDACEQ